MSDTHYQLLEVLSNLNFNTQEFILSPLQFGVPYSRPRYFCLVRTFEYLAMSQGMSRPCHAILTALIFHYHFICSALQNRVIEGGKIQGVRFLGLVQYDTCPSALKKALLMMDWWGICLSFLQNQETTGVFGSWTSLILALLTKYRHLVEQKKTNFAKQYSLCRLENPCSTRRAKLALLHGQEAEQSVEACTFTVVPIFWGATFLMKNSLSPGEPQPSRSWVNQTNNLPL